LKIKPERGTILYTIESDPQITHQEVLTMTEKMHACPGFPHFLHGADYNPEQWLPDKEIWDRDMELMKQACCNEMSVGIFSWAMLEPREGEYDFSFLDEIIEKIGSSGGKVILATPSGARPRWMAEKYPEVLRVGPDGVREHFRARHNHCLTSPVYRQKVREMNRRLAQRYGKNDTVVAWHISNEYGGECRCPLCVDAFRDYLRKKFGGDIDKLNRAYWTTFWSHNYDSFDQIEPPGVYTDTGIHGLNLDWRRFITEQTMSFIENETAPIRELSPDKNVTINMMFEFYDLDYHRLSRVIDIASWDSYPEWHNGSDVLIAQKTAFWHDLYRRLKDRPFLLMESTPSLVNWKPYNKLKAPGLDVLSSLQAVAHGSDSVQYFQWRKSRGSSEKFHGAVVGHDGTADTRVFQAVRKTGQILQQLDEIAGTRTPARAAVIFDWENMWALDDCQGYANVGKQYFETCYSWHREFWKRGIDCDIVAPGADLSRYKIVAAPMLYLLKDEDAENLNRYVSAGGTLVSGYMLSTVDEHDLCRLGGIPGHGLKEVFGLVAEEIDTLYPGERVRVTMDGADHEAEDYVELLKLRGAETLAAYESGWYKDFPAVTTHKFGAGRAVYLACRDTGSLKDRIFGALVKELDLTGPLEGTLPQGLTAHTRTGGGRTYVFLENYSSDSAAPFTLRTPMEDLLTGEMLQTGTIAPYGFRVFRTNP